MEGTERRNQIYFFKEGFDSFTYPLHFIDFETSIVVIPFNTCGRPYEQTTFQFSHYTMDSKGNISHAGQFISTNQGESQNYNFLRALKIELENDEGTIFRYAAHGNVINPSKLLPKLFDGVEETEDFLTGNSYLVHGGAAMTAHTRMQFINMPEIEKDALIQGLVCYCELDTLAMVMIFEAWREWIG